MMRWKAMVLGMALAVVTVAGCTQTCYLTEDDAKTFYAHRLNLPANLPDRADLGAVSSKCDLPAPPDVNNPEREPYYLTLNEAIARSLENGTTGFTSVRNLGIDNIDLLQDAQGNFSPRT